MRTLAYQGLVLLFALSFYGSAAAAERPNIVWIVSEDNSRHYMQHFEAGGASTPNIEALAEEGITFDRAFSNSPVCSVARTVLATGIHAPRIAAHHHRKLEPVRLPQGWRLFPSYLRDAGYYTANRQKTDYNVLADGEVWDESSGQAHWRGRPGEGTPFFYMRSLPTSHESRLHFGPDAVETEPVGTDPETIDLFPYFPDTELFRYTHARYLDCIRRVDRQVGRLIEELKEDGLYEETIIFYFGDHGGVLPRSKGYIYETGVHVPLVIRIPEKFRARVPFEPGSRVDRFVSFVDFAPTVLRLAGVQVPKQMDGRAFLGPDVTQAAVAQRDETFSYADRFDEKYDMVRGLRKGRYKYLRNYQAFYPDALQNNYRYRMLAYRQWRRLYHEGRLAGGQRQFFEPRAPEALYDLETDPHEVRNLADDPGYTDVLQQMRARLRERVKALPDLGFFPEPFLLKEAVEQPDAFGRARKDRIERLVDVADLALLPFAEARDSLQKALDSQDRWVRYWALIACTVLGDEAEGLASEAERLLADDELLVRVRAAEFLGSVGAADPVAPLKGVLRKAESPSVALLTLNTLVFLRDVHGYSFEIAEGDIRSVDNQVRRRLEYLSSSDDG